MTENPVLGPADLEWAEVTLGALATRFSSVVVGQERLLRSLLTTVLSSGHVLLESVPGLAKTLAASTLASSFSASFARVQCTPDLLPSDIIGSQIFDPSTKGFVTELGPVHANFILLDEINRSSAKTQSAMLEAMEERQTTIAGVEYPLPEPFLVMATQNPVDQEGTYPLSEAQTDRFMLKELVHYPSITDEIEMIDRMDAGRYDRDRHPAPVVSLDDVRRVQEIVRSVHLDRALVAYASRLVAVTREPAQHLPSNLARLIEYGASPRATIAFCRSARALAVIHDRGHVVPEDISMLAHRVLRHRLILGFEAASARITPDAVVDAVLQTVPVP